jgi:hypothetical protein
VKVVESLVRFRALHLDHFIRIRFDIALAIPCKNLATNKITRMIPKII